MNAFRQFRRWNRWVGAAVWLVAAIVFMKTRESSGSLWDCGEFLAASYRLEVVHPPGAPFFLMLNRLFSLAAPSPETIAYYINAQSSLSSAFVVLFLFWTITFLARKLVIRRFGSFQSRHIPPVLMAGALGALTFMFTDTFWFNAVEAEVYALSTLFMALVFWLMTIWEQRAEEPDHLKWIVLIAYLMGLSVGVHLLSLLAIPALGVIWYFRQGGVPNFRGVVIGGMIGVAALAFFQIIMLKGIPKVASKLELFFVNTLGLPYWSGVLFFILMLFIAMGIGAYYFRYNRPHPYLYSLAIVVVMVLIAYSTYAMVVIRSKADPPIDMNNPEDVFSLMSYINREQYGDRPFLYGPWFGAKPIRSEKGDPIYRPVNGKYEVIGYRQKLVYRPQDKMFFPRMGDPRNDRIQFYMMTEGLRPNQKPTMGQNLHFFFTYQMGHMFWRYFAWNFLGRQNDITGLGGELLSGNWLTGIKLLDEMRLGPQDNLPYFQRRNKAHNPLFMLLFITGVVGAWYQFRYNRRWAWAVFTFFFMTGVALILYLNNPPIEPRERDYTLVGAFYVFAMWIGLGGLAIYDWAKHKVGRHSVALAILGAFVVGMPLLTASQEWDDHDRSGRYLARAIGWNYLMSCDSNAILFTSGDNETYPLWYIQEVEGVRRDVRVINLSLLNTDWYHVELRQPTVDGALGVPFTIPVEKLWGKREYFIYEPGVLRIPQDKYVDLDKIITILTSDDPRFQFRTSDGEAVNFLPTKKFRVKVDSMAVVQSGIIPPKYYSHIVDEIRIDFPKNVLLRSDLLVLDLVAHTDWTRPICFSSTTGPSAYIGLEPYFRQQGVIYQLTPVRWKGTTWTTPTPTDSAANLNDSVANLNDSAATPHSVITENNSPWIDEDKMYNILRHRFEFGGLEKRKMWVDFFNSVSLRNWRITYVTAAQDLLKKGDTVRAVELIDYALEKIPEVNLPYSHEMIGFVQLYVDARQWEKARKLTRQLVEIYTSDAQYYAQLSPELLQRTIPEFQRNQMVLSKLLQIIRNTPLNEEFAHAINSSIIFQFPYQVRK